MKKLIIVLILMMLPFVCFGQSKETDELEQKMQQLRAEIRHQRFLLENEMIWQKTIMEIEIDAMFRRHQIRMITERSLYDMYRPIYVWEPVDLPYLYLPYFPLDDGFPLPYYFPNIKDCGVNTMDIIDINE